MFLKENRKEEKRKDWKDMRGERAGYTGRAQHPEPEVRFQDRWVKAPLIVTVQSPSW